MPHNCQVYVSQFNFKGLCTWILDFLGHVNTGIIFLCIGNSESCLHNTQSKSDWPFTTQSRLRVLQSDWLKLETDEKASLNIEMPY